MLDSMTISAKPSEDEKPTPLPPLLPKATLVDFIAKIKTIIPSISDKDAKAMTDNGINSLEDLSINKLSDIDNINFASLKLKSSVKIMRNCLQFEANI